MNELSNYATITGLLNNLVTGIESNTVTTELINELIITKGSNKRIWATGNLLYNISVINPNSASFNNLVITDLLDPKHILLITDSLRINGIPGSYSDFSYDTTTGVLVIELPIIQPNQTINIEFYVSKRNSEIFKLDNYAELDIYNTYKVGNKLVSNTVSVTALSDVCKCKENKYNTFNKNRN